MGLNGQSKEKATRMYHLSPGITGTDIMELTTVTTMDRSITTTASECNTPLIWKEVSYSSNDISMTSLVNLTSISISR